MADRVYSIGTLNSPVTVNTVAPVGGLIYTVTLASMPADTIVGDFLEDSASNDYAIEGIAGNDLTVRDLFTLGPPVTGAGSTQAAFADITAAATIWADGDAGGGSHGGNGPYLDAGDNALHPIKENQVDSCVIFTGAGQEALYTANRVELYPRPGLEHDGTAASGITWSPEATTGDSHLFVVFPSEEFSIRIRDLILSGLQSGPTNGMCVVRDFGHGYPRTQLFPREFLRNVWSETYRSFSSGNNAAYWNSDQAAVLVMSGNIFYGIGRLGGTDLEHIIRLDGVLSNSSASIYGNTLVNCSVTASGMLLKVDNFDGNLDGGCRNNIVHATGATVDYDINNGNDPVDSGTNISGDTSGSAGFQNVAVGDINYVNPNAGTDDYKRADGLGVGVDAGDSTNPPLDNEALEPDIDIIRQDRDAVGGAEWDIGAHEFVPVAGDTDVEPAPQGGAARGAFAASDLVVEVEPEPLQSAGAIEQPAAALAQIVSLEPQATAGNVIDQTTVLGIMQMLPVYSSGSHLENPLVQLEIQLEPPPASTGSHLQSPILSGVTSVEPAPLSLGAVIQTPDVVIETAIAIVSQQITASYVAPTVLLADAVNVQTQSTGASQTASQAVLGSIVIQNTMHTAGAVSAPQVSQGKTVAPAPSQTAGHLRRLQSLIGQGPNPRALHSGAAQVAGVTSYGVTIEAPPLQTVAAAPGLSSVVGSIVISTVQSTGGSGPRAAADVGQIVNVQAYQGIMKGTGEGADYVLGYVVHPGTHSTGAVENRPVPVQEQFLTPGPFTGIASMQLPEVSKASTVQLPPPFQAGTTLAADIVTGEPPRTETFVQGGLVEGASIEAIVDMDQGLEGIV